MEKYFKKSVFVLILLAFVMVVTGSFMVLGLNKKVEVKAAGEHSHAVCGETNCSHDSLGLDHTSCNWTPITDFSTLTESGNYYLPSDVCLTTLVSYTLSHWGQTFSLKSYIYIASGMEVNLCLNGHKISFASETDPIEVDYGGTLTICDCSSGGTGEIELYYSGVYSTFYLDGTLNIYGGNYSADGNLFVYAMADVGDSTGNYLTDANGKKICPEFNMYGGSVVGDGDGALIIVEGYANIFGGTLQETSGGCSLAIFHDSEVRIMGGTIVGEVYNGPIWAVSGEAAPIIGSKLYISGGLITSNSGPAVYNIMDNEVYISGGTLAATNTSESTSPMNTAVANNSSKKIYITGGSFSGKKGAVSLSGSYYPWPGGPDYSIYNYSGGISVMGGSFNSSQGITTKTNFVESGYTASNVSGRYVVVADGSAVASVTVNGVTSDFTHIDDAFIAAKTSYLSTLTVFADVSSTKSLEATGNFILDLNGHTITGPTSTPTSDTITVLSGSKLVIKDSSASKQGKLQAQGTGATVNNAGTLEVLSGTFNGGSAGGAIRQTGSLATTLLKGGTYNTDVSSYVADGYNWQPVGSGGKVITGTPQHTHTYTLQAGTPATCTSTGVKDYYTCTCAKRFIYEGGSFVEIANDYDLTIPINSSNHSYGALVQRVAATCKDEGREAYYQCQLCSKYFTSAKVETTYANLTIPRTNNHVYGALQNEVPATCSSTGMMAYYHCSVCDKYFDETKAEKSFSQLTLAIDPDNHSFSTLNVRVPATCSETGLESYYTCLLCHKYFTEDKDETTYNDLILEKDLSNHSYGELVPRVDSTCAEKGREAYYRCDRCGKYFNAAREEKEWEQLEISLKDIHPWGSLVQEKKATCVETGVKAHYHCPVCLQYFTQSGELTEKDDLTIPINTATGHNYGTLVPAVAPTCTQMGSIAYYHCSLCDKYFNSDKVEKEWSEIELATIEHSYGLLIERKEKTCTEDGYYSHYRCSVCLKYFDTNKQETTFDMLVIKKGHVYGSLIPRKESTCTQHGMAAHYQCALCRNYFLDSDSVKVQAPLEVVQLPLAEHDLELIAEVPAKCCAGVAEHYKCRNCNHLFEVDNENNCAGNEVILSDLKIEPIEEHTGGYWIIDQAPTATEEGQRHKNCSVCGEAYIIEVMPKLADDNSNTTIIASVAGGGSVALGFAIFAGALARKKKKDDDDDKNKNDNNNNNSSNPPPPNNNTNAPQINA